MSDSYLILQDVLLSPHGLVKAGTTLSANAIQSSAEWLVERGFAQRCDDIVRQADQSAAKSKNKSTAK